MGGTINYWQNRILCFVAATMIFSACMNPQQADTIYTQATIWTGVENRPFASAMAIKDGNIVVVGDAKEVSAWKGKETRIVDLEGAFVVPGFIDNHVHFMSGGQQLASINLRTAASKNAFIQTFADFISQLEPGNWIKEAIGITKPGEVSSRKRNGLIA